MPYLYKKNIGPLSVKALRPLDKSAWPLAVRALICKNAGYCYKRFTIPQCGPKLVTLIIFLKLLSQKRTNLVIFSDNDCEET